MTTPKDLEIGWPTLAELLKNGADSQELEEQKKKKKKRACAEEVTEWWFDGDREARSRSTSRMTS